MTTVPEYVTKSELDMRLNVITERQTQEAERNAERYSSMESLLDSKLTMMQLMMEKNFAQYQAIVSAMRAEIREFCSDVKSELSAMRAEGSGLLGDIHALRKMTSSKYPKLPYFILGHSMGSFLTRQYIAFQKNYGRLKWVH